MQLLYGTPSLDAAVQQRAVCIDSHPLWGLKDLAAGYPDIQDALELYRGHLHALVAAEDSQMVQALQELQQDTQLYVSDSNSPHHGPVIFNLWQQYTDKGLQSLTQSVRAELDYRNWLLTKLLAREPMISTEYRERYITKQTLPMYHRSARYLTQNSQTYRDLYVEILAHGSWEEGLLALRKTYTETPMSGSNLWDPKTEGLDHINVSPDSVLLWVRQVVAKAPTAVQFYSAIAAKKELRAFIDTHPEIKEALAESCVPFVSYRAVYKNAAVALYPQPDRQWLAQELDLIRSHYDRTALKVIIAGSRSIKDMHVLKRAVALSRFSIYEIISGGAKGVDELAEHYAYESATPLTVIPADWDMHGKSAGYKRNAKMAEHGQALIAIWDGKSPGTALMIKIMQDLGKPVYIYRTDTAG